MQVANIQPPPEKERFFTAPNKKTSLSLGIFQGTRENHRPWVESARPYKVFLGFGVALNAELEAISLVNIRHFPEV